MSWLSSFLEFYHTLSALSLDTTGPACTQHPEPTMNSASPGGQNEGGHSQPSRMADSWHAASVLLG